MKTISIDFARELIDFAPTERTRRLGFAESQLNGAVAAYNMIARNGLAYLADEVGMGKTYVALGVMGLLRHLEPEARVMVIAPRENIQRKWIKELLNFVRVNWRLEDNRVKALDGRPVYQPLACDSLHAMAATASRDDQRDPILRMTSFSIATSSAKDRQRHRKHLLSQVPWVGRKVLSPKSPEGFRDAYGLVLNAIIPDVDLLIVDEAHNLRHGFGLHVSTRNRVLGMALGHPSQLGGSFSWYGRRVKRLLLLSATPFEYDYADIYHQLDVLGFAGARVSNSEGLDPIAISELAHADVGEDRKREVVSRMLLRRVSYLKIAGEEHSKNMYRREWRSGGYERHDDPMTMTDTKQRLVVGLMQKKVAEILGGKRFNHSFQIGMLSSFESFMETMRRRRVPVTQVGGDSGNEEEDPVFVGEQQATQDERRGIDTHSIDTVVSSYRRRFGQGLPHPKLDATANALTGVFQTGEKALVFVRRVATVTELKSKMDQVFDCWIRQKMEQALPHLAREIEDVFVAYCDAKADRPRSAVAVDSSHDHVDQVEEDLRQATSDDEGGTDSFFAWFFRGEGPPGLLSGAAFQKNRLSSEGSVYGTVFEENYVSWLLGRPPSPLEAMSGASGKPVSILEEELRRRAFGYFQMRTERKAGYPRRAAYESYQVAGLQILAEQNSSLSDKARMILLERFPYPQAAPKRSPDGFPRAATLLGLGSFFTEIVKRPKLRAALWPDSSASDFRDRFRAREIRRELISAMARLGASYIDLYLTAIQRLDSFDFRSRTEIAHPDQVLVVDFLDLLEIQAANPGFHAFYELSSSSEAFETLLFVNFPEVHHAKLWELPEIFGRALQHQVPSGRMSGGVNKRLVRQFRMPGFPLVLATTDVLQEGEDLHTFCRNVVHYGVTWTPSAMEQRTGRVDRIGSLIQRRLDGRAEPAAADEMLQVYFPHLTETVEVFQVQTVLERLDKFLRLIHRAKPEKLSDLSRIDIAARIVAGIGHEVPRNTERLESAFPVSDGWLQGDIRRDAVFLPDVLALEKLLADLWTRLMRDLGVEQLQNSPRRYAGWVNLVSERVAVPRRDAPPKKGRVQRFELGLRSQVVGSSVFLQCTSPVGMLDLDDPDVLDELYGLHQDLGMVKVCARYEPRKRAYLVSIKGSRLFDPELTQYEEVRALVESTVEAADAIEEAMFGQDEILRDIPAENEDDSDG